MQQRHKPAGNGGIPPPLWTTAPSNQTSRAGWSHAPMGQPPSSATIWCHARAVERRSGPPQPPAPSAPPRRPARASLAGTASWPRMEAHLTWSLRPQWCRHVAGATQHRGGCAPSGVRRRRWLGFGVPAGRPAPRRARALRLRHVASSAVSRRPRSDPATSRHRAVTRSTPCVRRLGCGRTQLHITPSQRLRLRSPDAGSGRGSGACRPDPRV